MKKNAKLGSSTFQTNIWFADVKRCEFNMEKPRKLKFLRFFFASNICRHSKSRTLQKIANRQSQIAKLDFLKLFLIPFIIALSNILAFSQNIKILMPFSVLTKSGEFFNDLKADDLKLSHDKTFFQIESLNKKTDQNCDVVIMIDLSTSQERTIYLERKISQNFINSSLKKEKDRVDVVGFTGEVTDYLAFTNDFAAARQKIENLKIKFPEGYQPGKVPGGIIVSNVPLRPGKGDKKFMTAIWESVKKVSGDYFDKSKPDRKKIIFLITDGIDTSDEALKKTAIETVIRNNVQVYAVGVGDDAYDGVDKKSLRDIASATGGIAFFPTNTDDLPKIFQSIEQSVRSDYIAEFTDQNQFSKQSLNEVKVEIISPELKKNLQIVQKKGLFASN